MRPTQKYKSLPYNPALRSLAKEQRKKGLLHEALFWNQIKSGKLNGLDFDRQKIIGNYIVDFYCAQKNTVIELDGSSHDGKVSYDKQREEFLVSLGLEVIHIGVSDVLKNMDGVIEFLKDHPALTGTPPKEGNLKKETTPSPDGTTEGNLKKETAISGNPPEEGNKHISNSSEGNKKQDGNVEDKNHV